MDCLFCDIREKEYYTVLRLLETEHFFSIADPHPVSPGHALIIPKKHTVSLLDLDQEQWLALQSALQETVAVIERTDFEKLYDGIIAAKPTGKSTAFCERMKANPNLKKKPDGYNIGNNDGEAAGRTIHHLHVQIIPRYASDVSNPTGGIRTIMAGLGDYRG